VAKEGAKAFGKAVDAKRRMIAKEELDAQKDLDGDGVIGGVGCGPRQRERLRREQGRRANRKRKILERGG
jgi:hypothetical protein